jgi:hypothetical protein
MFESGLEVYEVWGSKSWEFPRFPRKIGELRFGEVGLVLESLEGQGGNGCKILFRGDVVGWVNFNLLKRL